MSEDAIILSVCILTFGGIFTVGLVHLSRKISSVHDLVNSRLSEMIEHIVAAGKAEALLAALQSRMQGREEGKAEASGQKQA